MRFIVLGCGSIGKRHIANLLSLGHEVVAWNRSAERREQVRKLYSITVFEELEDLFLNSPAEGAIVATPQTCHLYHALAAVQNNLHLFIEKPVAHTLEGLDTLVDECERKALVVQVGCNMRFHYGPASVKGIIDNGIIGRPIWGQIWGGMHLPDWHPDEDYRELYSAKRSMGGGAVLDFIHEIDLTRWLFGEPAEVVALTSRSGWLEIETEDIVDAIFRYESGLQVNMHLDYLQRPFQRGIRVVGTQGWVEWNLFKQNIEIFSHCERRSEIMNYPVSYDHNSMYLQQMTDFIGRITRGGPELSGLQDGISALKLALRIKVSSKKKQFN